jgi:hypothetical protein
VVTPEQAAAAAEAKELHKLRMQLEETRKAQMKLDLAEENIRALDATAARLDQDAADAHIDTAATEAVAFVQSAAGVRMSSHLAPS